MFDLINLETFLGIGGVVVERFALGFSRVKYPDGKGRSQSGNWNVPECGKLVQRHDFIRGRVQKLRLPDDIFVRVILCLLTRIG